MSGTAPHSGGDRLRRLRLQASRSGQQTSGAMFRHSLEPGENNLTAVEIADLLNARFNTTGVKKPLTCMLNC